MARNVFFSFHYDADNWRASQVRNIGALEGNAPCSDNDWERVKRGGDPAIARWIDGQLNGRSCAIVLIGQATAGRKWIDYEISRAWELRKAVLGIYIHHLKDRTGNQASRGQNPFSNLRLSGTPLDSIVKAYDPPYWSSTDVYQHIAANIGTWVEEAVAIRALY
jgi:hypothetical protein